LGNELADKLIYAIRNSQNYFPKAYKLRTAAKYKIILQLREGGAKINDIARQTGIGDRTISIALSQVTNKRLSKRKDSTAIDNKPKLNF
jgi:hypothetical protein